MIRVKLGYVVELPGDARSVAGFVGPDRILDLIIEGLRVVQPDAIAVLGGAKLSATIVRPRSKR